MTGRNHSTQDDWCGANVHEQRIADGGGTAARTGT